MKNKKLLLIISSILLVLVISYLIPILIYNQDVFAKKTIINNIDISGLTIKEAQDKINKESQKNIIIKKRDGKEEKLVLGNDSPKIIFEDSLNNILSKQSRAKWLQYLISGDIHSIDFKTEYNKDKIDEKIMNLNMIINPTIQDPQDAYIEEDDGGFRIVKEVAGNRVNAEKLKEIIYENLQNQNYNIDLTNEDIYLKPNIKSDSSELMAQLKNFEKLKDLHINIDMVGATEELSFSDLKNYISFDEEGHYKFDKEKMYEDFSGYANKYNTFGSVRTFNTTKLGAIQVGGSKVDSYGFQLAIKDTVEAVIKAINEGKSDVKAVWKIPAMVRNENDDIGKTYVEIDLSRQHLWYYVNGELKLESDIVSGKDSSPTPTGVNRVWHKQRNKTLIGADWRQPVDYWMPFNWENCGMHDSNYRKAFGGKIYHRNGSHGCINMPPKKAKALYEMIKLDTPVIVYKSAK